MISVKTAFVSVGLALIPAAAMAQQGSASDEMACTPDVYRLCAAQVPDETAIVSCLERNKASLSAACKQVFSRPEKAHSKSQQDDEDVD